MQPEANATRPRYRSELVFRSAERLIASRPARPPSPRLPRRSLIFLLGITCGLGLAFLVWRTVEPIAPVAAQREPGTTTIYRERKRLNLPLADARANFGANAPERSEQRSNAPTANSTPPVADPTTPARRTAPAPVAATRSTAAVPAGNTMTPAVILTRFTTSFKLRGEVRATNGTKSHIEFELQLLPAHAGGTVQGFARYLDGNPRPRDPIQLVGVWINRTLTLHEPGKGSSPPEPQGWMFVLEFPETDASDDITGYWGHWGQHGTLALKPMLPL